ncbi:MAG: DNA recombination protein RmuC [Propionibacteriaceae bacterium]|jgi:DNA recombination protein RmuC|nr:DNA recombination protein RmuC [Propionibacteriaceae bacterium]
MDEITWIILALAGGIALGWLACYLVSGARKSALAERGRADIAEARSEAATARAEAASSRAEMARWETEIERARVEGAEARSKVAEIGALLARQEGLILKVEVERDAALEQAEQLRVDRETMLNSYKSLSTEALDRQAKVADETAAQRLAATDQLMSPVRQGLEKLDARLTEIEKERSAMAAQMTNEVRSVKLTGEQLRRETAALATALRKPTVRGAWGEIQLKRVVEVAGMVEHCDFVTQESSTTDERAIRPDLKVHLAGGKFVYVDAKTPLEGFLDAEETDSESERAKFLAVFARRVRTHVDQLASKAYWKADSGTPEFVILFLPSEALLATALDQAPDLVEYAAGRNVILATPMMLIATLRAIAYAWSQEVLAASAKEISQLGRELYDRLGKMGARFDRLGRSLDASVRTYNEAIGSLEGRVMVAARRFRDLKVSEEELTELSGVTQPIRLISAPELVADAAEIPALIGRSLASVADPITEPIEVAG